jgi:hypothetical protein
MSERLTPGDRDRKTQAITAPVTPPTLTAAEETQAEVVSYGLARLRQALPKLVGRCMSFSANPHFDDALVAAVNRFYGVEVDVATAETDILEDDFERVRFFPWFLWDFPLPAHESETVSTARSAAHGSPTIGTRFLAEADLSDYDRRLIEGLADSTVSFVEVVATEPARGELVLRDLHHGDALVVFDQTLAADLIPDQLALVRLVRLESSAGEPLCGLVDAIYAVLPATTRPVIEDELARLLDGEPDVQAVLKNQAPELLDFAEQVLAALEAPADHFNADGEPLVLCRTVIRTAASDELCARLDTLAEFAVEGPLRIWREDDRVVGWLATDNPARLVIEATSRERFERIDQLLSAAGFAVPRMRAEVELAAAVTDWLARGETDRWLLDGEVDAAFRSGLERWLVEWPDTPHPSLGKRTPRDLARDPRGAETLDRLIGRVRAVVGEDGRMAPVEELLVRG